jgi:hypothetical protein
LYKLNPFKLDKTRTIIEELKNIQQILVKIALFKLLLLNDIDVAKSYVSHP